MQTGPAPDQCRASGAASPTAAVNGGPAGRGPECVPLLLEDLPEDGRRFLLAPQLPERHGLPEEELHVAGRQAGGLGVFLERLADLLLRDVGVAPVLVPVGAPQPDQPLQLPHRMRMVLHAEVHDAVLPRPVGALSLHDQDGRRLPPADVAARALARLERGQEAGRQIPGRPLVGPRHVGPDVGVDHEVRLDGVLRSHLVAGVGDAAVARVRGHPAACVDHRHLAHVATVVLLDQLLQGIGRALPPAHQLEPSRAVGHLHQRLRRHGAHAGLRPRDHRSDREVVGLDRDPDLARPGVPRDDGEGVDRPARVRGAAETRVAAGGCRRIRSSGRPCRRPQDGQERKYRDGSSNSVHRFPPSARPGPRRRCRTLSPSRPGIQRSRRGGPRVPD
jgi:hypothetical protein